MWKQWSNNRGLVLLGFILLAVFLIDTVFVFAYYHKVIEFLNDQPMWEKADAGIVFFGDYADDGARLGPDSKKRALCAAELYRSGKIHTIICVGGYEINQWKGKPHRMKQYLVDHKVSEKDILYDSLSFNTLTNIQEAKKILGSKRFHSAVAISSPLHVYRISKLFQNGRLYFEAYTYRPSSLKEYWQLFRDVHREWVSRLLSLVLKDDVRNRMVYIYRALNNRLKPIF